MTQLATGNQGTQPFSDTTAQLALAVDTNLTYTVPGDPSQKYRAEFKFPSSSNVWVGYNVAATQPAAGTITNTSNIELNPTLKFVKGGDVLSFRSHVIVTDAGLSLLRLL